MNGLGKPFRKKSDPKNRKNRKSEIAACEQKTTSQKANFCSNTIFSLCFNFRAKKFHAAKPLKQKNINFLKIFVLFFILLQKLNCFLTCTCCHAIFLNLKNKPISTPCPHPYLLTNLNCFPKASHD